MRAKDYTTPPQKLYTWTNLDVAGKVSIHHQRKVLDTFVALDDGSERTILLATAAQHLGLKGRPFKQFSTFEELRWYSQKCKDITGSSEGEKQ